MARTEAYREIVESQLERMDDQAGDAAGEPEPAEHLEPDPYGFHVDDPDLDLLDDDLDAGLRDDVEADALEALAEGFNARNLDAVLELVAEDGELPGLLGNDRDNLPAALQEIWQRRPSVLLARGRVEVDHVGVVWEHDGASWWRVAVVHLDDVVDGRIGVVVVSDDAALLDRVVCEAPTADDLDEGVRWSEWEHGATETS